MSVTARLAPDSTATSLVVSTGNSAPKERMLRVKLTAPSRGLDRVIVEHSAISARRFQDALHGRSY